jgi:hypothetical protein
VPKTGFAKSSPINCSADVVQRVHNHAGDEQELLFGSQLTFVALSSGRSRQARASGIHMAAFAGSILQQPATASSLSACRRRPAMQAAHASGSIRNESLPPGAGSLTAAAAPEPASAASLGPPAAVQTRTCRRCKQQFDPAINGMHSCRHHSAMYTGGEISKVGRAPSKGGQDPCVAIQTSMLDS